MVMHEGEGGSHRRLPTEVNNLTKHGPSSSNGVNGNPFTSDGRHGNDGEHLHSLEAVNGTVATSRNNLQVAPSPTSSLSSGKVQSIFDGNCIPFPLLPPSVEKVSPDDVMTFKISCNPTSTNAGKAREVDLVTIFTAAWSLVATRSSGFDGVSFGIRSSSGLSNGKNSSRSIVEIQVHPKLDYPIVGFLQLIQSKLDEASRTTFSDKSQPGLLNTLVVIHTGAFNPELVQSSVSTDNHAVIFDIYPHGMTITGAVKFDSRVVESTRFKRLLLRLESAMHDMIGLEADQVLECISLMTQDDIKSIWDWNKVVPKSVERCLHDLITEWVQSQPGAPAVCAWDGNLTYRDLDRLAEGLYSQIMKTTQGRVRVIPLCIGKSMWTPVAMLAVLKAGAAFTLIDPHLSLEHMKEIVRELDASLVVTISSFKELASNLGEEVAVLDAQSACTMSAHVTTRVHTDVSSPAYVVMAVDSCGGPKHVYVSHCNMASAIYHQAKLLHYTADARILDVASCSSDLSIYNNISALSVGGCICIPREEHDSWVDSIESLKATHLICDSSAVASLTPEEVPGLKSLTILGGAATTKDVEHWEGHVTLASCYGTTGSLPISTILVNVTHAESLLGVGRGEGVCAWLVDPSNDQRLQPVGHVGEIVLEGPLIVKPDRQTIQLSAPSFVQDPAWLVLGSATRPGRSGRVFKTGDLAYYNEDGSLRLVGHQKDTLNATRHHLYIAAVEYFLRSIIPGTALAVVQEIIGQETNARPVLVAILQLKNDMTSSFTPKTDTIERLQIPEDIVLELSRHLPAFMLPSTYLTMSSLPRRLDGQVDDASLQSQLMTLDLATLPTRSGLLSGPERNKIKESTRMQQAWANVLGIEPKAIHAHDNFFQLGGDSITALKVVSEVRKVGLESSVTDIFRHQKLDDIVRHTQNPGESYQHAIPPFSLLDSPLDKDLLCTQYGFSPSTIVDAYPCTPLQEGLMSLSQLRPTGYIMQSVLELSSSIDLSKFRQAWERVVQASDILRTYMVQQNDAKLIQVVVNESIEWIEATGLNAYLRDDSYRQMGLGQHLSRYAMVGDGTGRTRWFVWTIHHAAYDGWTQQLVINAVNRAYRGESLEDSPAFNSFCKYVKDRSQVETLAFWRDNLAGCSNVQFPALTPEISPPAADQTLEHQISLSRSRPSNITTSTLIHAAWALVVGYETNNKDIVFGTTVSGRNAPIPSIDAMMAPTIATIPMRIQWSSENLSTEYLQDIQRISTEVIEFEQAGLQHIRKVSPDALRACDFQTLVIIQPQIDEGADYNVLGTWTWDDLSKCNPYALMVEVELGNNGQYTTRASFDSRAIKSNTVKSLLQRLGHAMQLLSDCDQEQKLADISVMMPQEVEQIREWNKDLPIAAEFTIHELVARRARDQPQAQAVHAWDGTLSYAELEQKATALAHHLRNRGITTNALVPLCFEKSMWASVAMLATLKAGAAFVLLDPSLPEQRLQAIVDQLGCHLILSSKANAPLSSRLSANIIEVNAYIPVHVQLDVELDDLQIYEPALLTMFVVFTSGSTGTPKGVLISHKNFASALAHQAKVLGFSENSRTFDFASYAFDVSVFNAFYTFVQGGCLCVPSEEERQGDLAKVMNSMGATITHLTPSVSTLVDPKSVPQLETLMLGGEAVPEAELKRWSASTTVITTYGPAECTPTSTIHFEEQSSDQPGRIGKGAGVITWIVDEEDHNVLLPPGSVGELLLEGPLVSQGYLNDPEKTASVFFEAPPWMKTFSPRSGSSVTHGKLYKTGDLVHYDLNGSLIFVGRKDSQVKIRGQRVELGEIEFWLHKYLPHVPRMVVDVIKPRDIGDVPVVAAFRQDDISQPGNLNADLFGENSVQDIRPLPTETEEQLLKHIPGYMVPSCLIHVKHLPMTSTGKLDRRRLREASMGVSMQQIRSRKPFSGEPSKQDPTTDEERALRNVWAKVLNLSPDSIGVDESFYRLGGDSITAMQVAAAARHISMHIHARDVLRERTIRNLAKTKIDQWPKPTLPNGHLAEKSSCHSTLLSPIQRLYFKLQPRPTSCFDQCYFLRTASDIGYEAFTEALAVIVRRHGALRCRFVKGNNGIWEQKCTDNIGQSFTVTRESITKADLATTISACRSQLDIENGPILAAKLLDIDDYQAIFVTIHHLVVDFVSWRIILSELEALLTSQNLPMQSSMDFPKWILEQSKYFRASLHVPTVQPVSDLSYWGLDESTNFKSGTVVVEFTISEDETSRILGPCNDANETQPLELFLAGLIYSFRQIFKNRPGPRIFCEGHGREYSDKEADISSTVGWFTTIFPAQVDEDGSLSLQDLILRTKKCMRGMSETGWLNFTSQFIDEQASSQAVSQFPVEILFNYAGRHHQSDGTGGLFEFIPLPDDCEPPSSKQLLRTGLFEIEARVEKGMLSFQLSYHRSINYQGEVRDWFHGYKSALRSIANEILVASPSWTVNNHQLDGFASPQSIPNLSDSWLAKHAISAQDIEDVFACSPVQEGILVAQLKDPEAYKLWFELEISPAHLGTELDLEKLQGAWRAVVKRHTLLRSILASDMPGTAMTMHVVLKDPHPSFECNIAHDEGGSCKLHLDTKPFMSSNKLQHHVIVNHYDTTHATLRFEFNHAILDGFSRVLLARDFQAAYDGMLAPAAQYSTFITYLQQQSSDDGISFWKDHLYGVDPCLLPQSSHSLTQGPYAESIEVQNIDTTKLRAFCAEWDLTAAVIIQLAWAVVLGRYTATKVPCFGSLHSGRDIPLDNIDDMFGPLIAMTPRRVHLDDTKTILSMIEQVQSDYWNILPHQYVPLTAIHHATGQGAQQIFNTVLSLQRGGDYEQSRHSPIRVRAGRNHDPNEVCSYFGLKLNIVNPCANKFI